MMERNIMIEIIDSCPFDLIPSKRTNLHYLPPDCIFSYNKSIDFMLFKKVKFNKIFRTCMYVCMVIIKLSLNSIVCLLHFIT